MSLLDHAPVIDDRTFDDIIREARSRIPGYAEEWTDTNAGDPGFALVELFAWMTEMLIYRMGRVPQLNYLAFLDLIGFELLPARPARAEITFPVRADHPQATVLIGPRTQVATESPDESGRPIVFETEAAIVALRARLASVWIFDGYRHDEVTTANEELTGFEPFGRSPATGAAMLLGFDDPGEFPSVELDLAVWVADGDREITPVSCGSAAVSGSPVDLRWEYWDGRAWRALRVRSDATLGLTRSGHVVLGAPPPAALKRARIGTVIPDTRYWIRARLAGGAYQHAPRLFAIRTNTASAIQAETVTDEVLGGSDGSPDQELQLNERPVLPGSLVLEVDEGSGPERWEIVEDFLGSDANSRHAVLDRSTGKVRFGNGVRGRIPVANPRNPSASIVAVEYRHGGGKRDNLGPGTITALRSSLQGIDSNRVKNLFAASAGSDQESLQAAIERAQGFLKSRDRAVTAEDFEVLALAAGVARARALALYHPDYPDVELPGVVSVIVVPHGDGVAPMPTAFTLREVCAYLSARRMLTTELFVLPPRYRKVTVRAQLYVNEGADPGEVQRAAEEALDKHFHPLHGGTDGKGWPFGGTIYYTVTNHVLMVVPDVVRVAELEITVDGVTGEPCRDIAIEPHDLIEVGEHDIQVYYEEKRR